jgi:hypothetical protein
MAAGHNRQVTNTRSGLFIIRAWVEPGSSAPLRAQIRHTTNVTRGFDRSLTVAQQEAVVAAVQAWLSAMLADAHGVGNDADYP